jgi:hypothetical protein
MNTWPTIKAGQGVSQPKWLKLETKTPTNQGDLAG